MLRRPMIDVHTHAVPAYIPLAGPRGRKWPSIQPCQPGGGRPAAEILIDGKLFRKIDARCWDTGMRIADMDEDGIAVQVLSPMPELLSYWLDSAEATDLADLVNDQIAGMVNNHPTRFIGLGMITAQEPARACEQLKKLKAAGFLGIEIGTHINGVPLRDKSLWPIYEAAEELELAIFVHPLHPAGAERIGATGDICAAAAFPMEIAFAALSLIIGGVMERFPDLKFLLSHGGGSLLSVLPRVQAAWDVSPAIREQIADKPHHYAGRFWYDSNVFDTKILSDLIARVGPQRVALGTDYPFALRQTEPVAFIMSAHPDACDIMSNAAARLFGLGALQ